MPKHDLVFYAMLFFLAGVFIASIFSGMSAAVLLAIASAAVFLCFKKYWLAGFTVFIVIGSSYYFLYDQLRPEPRLVFDQNVKLTGIITEAEQRQKSQKLIIENVQITAPRYPSFEYGDKVDARGFIKTPPEEFKNYFAKEGVSGLMSFPEIKLIAKEQGSPIKSALLKIKNHFEDSYKKVLPFEKAAFMSGLTLGSTADFSEDFNEKLRLTGTSHLVALSGYNISIIVRYIGGIFVLWRLTRKLKLPLSVIFVVGFIVMTGADASVVRAAIMAMILLLADHIGRVAYTPNVIIIAALAMVLINPKILAFDIGFQLSFMALLGIIYLEPWLREKFKAKDDPGFLGWRSHFWTTTSAQLAVLPVLLYHFGFVSPVSILTNVLLLEFIPITMGLGFFIGLAAAASYWLSWLIALPAYVFLAYELSIIDIFSKIMNI